MTEVVVFVDDAVRGDLPDICSKDGAPATGRFRIVTEVGRSNRLGIAWLLVFAGPLGWLVLLFLLGRDSGEQLAVELPYCDHDYERFVAARRLRTRFVLAATACLVALALLLLLGQLGGLEVLLFFGVAVAALVAAWVAEQRMSQATVGVTLDASRRWVTLQPVHPDFARACEARSPTRAG
jgi:hypothetical protein